MSAREDLRKKVDAEAVLYHNVCRYPFHYVRLVYQGLVGCGFAKWNVADADDADHPWNPDMGYRIARGRAVAEIIKQIEGKPVTCDEAPDAVVKRMQKAKLQAEQDAELTVKLRQLAAKWADRPSLAQFALSLCNGQSVGRALSSVKAGNVVAVSSK